MCAHKAACVVRPPCMSWRPVCLSACLPGSLPAIHQADQPAPPSSLLHLRTHTQLSSKRPPSPS
ncbi:hypothetical protein BDY21DRAFT_352944 [Lineolata rhizophorae]|uniref:Uncharacterized protein n=1 Tax=Lineolata rhizophorae TaxID=578093 RepID=A0A6A6NRU1_9PEZI|nr:hypothetical protein BDY21DRAFT_352944 [Lineolata rhizophorae]